MANTTWNPADLVLTTLSGGNLIATPTGQGGVRSIAGVTAGKSYFEVKFALSGSSSGVAVVNATAGLASVITTAIGAALVNNGGAISVNGTAQTGIGAFAANGTCCVALDMGSKLVWFRNGAAGNWNGSGTANPATGVGGYSVSALTGGSTTLFAFSGSTTGAGGARTANFGDTTYVGTPPVGFSNFGTPPIELAGNLGGSSSYGKLSYGLKKYSQVPAFVPAFGADFLVSAGVVFSGDFAPVVSFDGALEVFGFVDLGGDIAPQIALEGSLSLDLPLSALEGGLTPIVVLEASSFVSGTLWAEAEPCPSPPWAESEPCPPSMWTPIGPCDPVEWTKSELCNG